MLDPSLRLQIELAAVVYESIASRSDRPPDYFDTLNRATHSLLKLLAKANPMQDRAIVVVGGRNGEGDVAYGWEESDTGYKGMSLIRFEVL